MPEDFLVRHQQILLCFVGNRERGALAENRRGVQNSHFLFNSQKDSESSTFHKRLASDRCQPNNNKWPANNGERKATVIQLAGYPPSSPTLPCRLTGGRRSGCRMPFPHCMRIWQLSGIASPLRPHLNSRRCTSNADVGGW